MTPNSLTVSQNGTTAPWRPGHSLLGSSHAELWCHIRLLQSLYGVEGACFLGTSTRHLQHTLKCLESHVGARSNGDKWRHNIDGILQQGGRHEVDK